MEVLRMRDPSSYRIQIAFEAGAGRSGGSEVIEEDSKHAADECFNNLCGQGGSAITEIIVTKPSGEPIRDFKAVKAT